MRRLVLALLILAASLPAAAQTDVFCICAEATSGCGGNIDVGAFTQKRIHFVLMNPSSSSVAAWEAKIEITNDSNIIGTWNLVSGLNVSADPEFIVGLGSAHLTANSSNMIPLMTMDVLVLAESPVFFDIKGIPGSVSFYDAPGYVDGSLTQVEGETCVPAEGQPAFSINFAIDDENHEWGEVKTIYGQ